MAGSIVDIANKGLTYLGANAITALTDDTVEGRAINRIHEQSRQYCLRDHPWNFAMTRVSLAADTTTPVWEYANLFPWPSNCLRIIEVDTTEEWAVEGRNIVSDAAAPLNILYIADITDTSIYDAKFTEAYAMRLASDVAYEITSSQTVVASASAAYSTLIQEARLVDAQETTSASEDSWLSVRT
tara:strand:+ start:1688 stop:2242 length:555 start_codon:yes stop_codon:yes gene_type:complete